MNMMSRVFSIFLDKFVVIFIDDILICSKSKDGHAEHLRIISQTHMQEKFYVKFSKSEFWLKSIAFLGHIITSEGILMDPSKV